jgi:hypothetical protein
MGIVPSAPIVSDNFNRQTATISSRRGGLANVSDLCSEVSSVCKQLAGRRDRELGTRCRRAKTASSKKFRASIPQWAERYALASYGCPSTNVEL